MPDLTLTTPLDALLATTTAAGALAYLGETKGANLVWCGPASGSAATPTFRALVAADIPSLPYAPVASPTFTGTVEVPFLIVNGDNIFYTGRGYVQWTANGTAGVAPASGSAASFYIGNVGSAPILVGGTANVLALRDGTADQTLILGAASGTGGGILKLHQIASVPTPVSTDVQISFDGANCVIDKPILTQAITLTSASPAGSVVISFATNDELLFLGTGGNVMAIQVTDDTHFSSLVFRGSDGIERGAIGYANANVGGPFQGSIYREASYYTGVPNTHLPPPIREFQTGSFDGTTEGYNTKLRGEYTSAGLIKFYSWDASSLLTIDSVNNRVGVLTATPAVPLDVVGDSQFAGDITQASGNAFLVGSRTRVGNNIGPAIDSDNFGTLQLTTSQHLVACFSITQNNVATGHFGFAANSNVFVLGGDGAGITFRANPTASLDQGTEVLKLIFSSGNVELPVTSSGIVLHSPAATAYTISIANGGAVVTDAGYTMVKPDTGWTANADAGDKTVSIPSEADIATQLAEDSEISIGTRNLISYLCSEVKALRSALTTFLVPN